jgi:hypothetical protein
MVYQGFFVLSAEAKDNKNFFHHVACFPKQGLAWKSPAVGIRNNHDRNQARAKSETASEGKSKDAPTWQEPGKGI